MGDTVGSDPVRMGWFGGEDDPVDLVSMAVGGGIRGDFDLERNMLSVVVARVIDRA